MCHLTIVCAMIALPTMRINLRVLAMLVLTLMMFLGVTANAGEPRALKVGLYTPTVKVDDLFKTTVVPYEQLEAPYKEKADYYKSLFIKNDYNNGVGLRVHQTGMEVGSTLITFKLYIHYTNRYGQCGVAIMGVGRGGNYNYWSGGC